MEESKKNIIISLSVAFTAIVLLFVMNFFRNHILIKYFIFCIIFFIGAINLNWKKMQKRDELFVIQKIIGATLIGLFILRAYLDKFGNVIDALTGLVLGLWLVVVIKMIMVWKKN
ncbi:MAG: hypothetical protein QXJ06_05470 [Candidatus Aenigmatarchaeota archaeon]